MRRPCHTFSFGEHFDSQFGSQYLDDLGTRVVFIGGPLAHDRENRLPEIGVHVIGSQHRPHEAVQELQGAFPRLGGAGELHKRLRFRSAVIAEHV